MTGRRPGGGFYDEHVVAWPTLGFLAADWCEAHCAVPSGFQLGEPLRFDGWQLWCAVNHYRVRRRISPVDRQRRPRLGTAFQYRRSLVVGPQKCGKSPWAAAIMLFEAVGPCLFTGWAKGGELYRCVDHGCGCGFTFEYQPGDPMGAPRKKSLVQLLSYSEDQAENVYGPLKYMASSGPLDDFVRVREGFVRLPNGGKIEPVTTRMESRLGQPVDAALADESGLYTAANKVSRTWNTIRRGVAGMGGRTVELTNPWDPMTDSSAQKTFETRRPDVFKYYRKPPAHLSYRNARERHKIHQWVYADAPWVLVESIDREAAELAETNITEAERFFGNRLIQGQGSFLAEDVLTAGVSKARPDKRICLGFDGSSSGDWTAIRAEDVNGLRFTPTFPVGDEKRPTFWDPSTQPGGVIPRSEVRAAIAHLFTAYQVERLYCDPRDWRTEIEEWALQWGDARVVQWPTSSIGRMFEALNRYQTDLREGSTHHSPDTAWTGHALNARKVPKPGDKYLLGKPAEHMKIDLLMADVIAHEAASDARAEGWASQSTTVFSLGFT